MQLADPSALALAPRMRNTAPDASWSASRAS
jgi:hypothetical protein